MQSARDWIIGELHSHGLSPLEAKVMFVNRVRPGLPGMAERWDEAIGNFDYTKRSVMRLAAFHEAEVWLAKHIPDHPARAMFL